MSGELNLTLICDQGETMIPDIKKSIKTSGITWDTQPVTFESERKTYWTPLFLGLLTTLLLCLYIEHREQLSAYLIK